LVALFGSGGLLVSGRDFLVSGGASVSPAAPLFLNVALGSGGATEANLGGGGTVSGLT
jgi:hypothetical protein